MTAGQRFPVYSLIDGHVARQSFPGDRWHLVDDTLVKMMFEAFDGVKLGRDLTVTVNGPCTKPAHPRR